MIRYKMQLKDAYTRKNPTPVRSIRAKCIDCQHDQTAEITRCQITDCALWPYRLGTRPTEEDIEKNRLAVLSRYWDTLSAQEQSELVREWVSATAKGDATRVLPRTRGQRSQDTNLDCPDGPEATPDLEEPRGHCG